MTTEEKAEQLSGSILRQLKEIDDKCVELFEKEFNVDIKQDVQWITDQKEVFEGKIKKIDVVTINQVPLTDSIKTGGAAPHITSTNIFFGGAICVLTNGESVILKRTEIETLRNV